MFILAVAFLCMAVLAPASRARAQSGVLTTLSNFGSFAIGGQPDGALVLGTDGNFYGTSLYGGPTNSGTIFQDHAGGCVHHPAHVHRR